MKLNIRNIHNIGKRSLGRILLVGAAGMALIFSACMRDDLADGFGRGSGQKLYAKLSLNMMAPSANQVTRAASLDDDSTPKIDALWIGVFDSKTGEQLGRMAGHIRKSDDTRYTTQGTINGLDIFYYDSNPEVYIAAVANYTGVLAKKAGESDDELVTLSSLLGIDDDTEGDQQSLFSRAITWDEFRAISVNTESIEASELKNKNECPFMMGFFNTEYKGSHTMVNPDGSMPDNARVPLTEGGVQFAPEVELKGAIHLYRLVSEFKVNVRAAEMTNSPYKITVSNVQYKVGNRPLEVYLAERPTFEKGAIAGKDTYRNYTSNSADVAVIEKTAAGYITDEEWIDAEGSEEDGYYFSFQQYENKHIGADYVYGNNFNRAHLVEGEYVYFSTPFSGAGETFKLSDYLNYFMGGPVNNYVNNFEDWFGSNPWFYAGLVLQRNAHAIREARYTNDEDGSKSNLYRALVADADKDFNNNASYIVLRADVTIEEQSFNSSEPARHATVEYTIHEGFTTKADGTATITDFADAKSTDDVLARMFDFQCTRNTLYTYNIQINGFSDLEMQVDGKINHNDGLTGKYQATELYEYPSIGYKAYHDGFVDLENNLHVRYEDRSKLKWRFYEQRPVKDAQGKATGEIEESNYGTWDPNENPDAQFEWPELTTDMQSAEDCWFYKQMQISIWQRNFGSSGSSGSSSDASYYGFTELAGPMTIDEFIKSEDHQWLGQDYIYYALRIPEYEVDKDGERDYENYEYYRRGFYLYLDSTDADGCIKQVVYGLEQDVYDDRPGYNSSSIDYIFNHNHTTYNGNPDYNNSYYFYSGAEYWSTGLGVVSDDRIETKKKQIYPDFDSSVDITTYALEVKGYEPILIDIEQDPQYCIEYDWYYGDVISIPISEVVDKLGLEAGIYAAALYPAPKQPEYQPFKPNSSWFRPLIIHEPKWNFVTELQSEAELYNGDYLTYGGLTIVGGTGGSNTPAELSFNSKGGQLHFQGGGSVDLRDFRLLKFAVEQHGTVRITLNSNGTLRYGMRDYDPELSNKSFKKSATVPVNGTTVVEFNTRDLIDDFEDGPKEVVFYGDVTAHYYFYEVEFIVSDDQSIGLDGSTFGYSQEGTIGDNESYNNQTNLIHNHDIYYYNFYAVKGSTTYFAFTDSKPRASAYVFELYEDSNSSQPVFSQTFDAAECRTDTDKYGYGYFVLPVTIPSNATISTGSYCPKITPLGDNINYRDGSPHTLSSNSGNGVRGNFVKVIDFPEDWLNDEDHEYPNPFYDDNSTYNYNFNDKEGHFWDIKGLVLHGSNNANGVTVTSTYIQFGGAGYPYNSRQGTALGRYLSFSTDKPGTLFLNAGCVQSADDRKFVLYKNTATGPEKVGEATITANNNTRGDYKISVDASHIDGMTEFFLCTDNGNLRLYSLSWSDDPNGKRTIRTKFDWTCFYGEKSGAETSNYNNKRNEYEYERVPTSPYNQSVISAIKHFATDYAFIDSNPIAQEYKLELYNINSGAPSSSPTYSETLTSLNSKWYTKDDGSRKVSCQLFFDDTFEEGIYSVMVTPIGDPEFYAESEPYLLNAYIRVHDWQKRGYYMDDTEEFTNFAYWSPHNYSNLSNDNGTARLTSSDDGRQLQGMTITGGGTSSSVIISGIDPKNPTSNSYYNISGAGYPQAKADNLGGGRNFTMTIDMEGEFWMVARCNSTSASTMYLYSEDNLSTEQDSQAITPTSGQALRLIAKPVVLKTGAVNKKTKFYICPDSGGCTVFGMFFVPKDSPLYDYWSTHGDDDGEHVRKFMKLAGETSSDAQN